MFYLNWPRGYGPLASALEAAMYAYDYYGRLIYNVMDCRDAGVSLPAMDLVAGEVLVATKHLSFLPVMRLLPLTLRIGQRVSMFIAEADDCSVACDIAAQHGRPTALAFLGLCPENSPPLTASV